MIDLLKKTLATGLGLAVMTRDKVEELGRELAKTAKLSETEGSDFIKELHQHADSAQKELQARIDREVHRVVEHLHLATREEVTALHAKIDELSRKLDRPGHPATEGQGGEPLSQ
jgi:polyhydroxyalkanoate synthesis regulator phasin